MHPAASIAIAAARQQARIVLTEDGLLADISRRGIRCLIQVGRAQPPFRAAREARS